VHAIIVLLPLSALLLVLSAVRPVLRRLAGPNAILSLVVLVLVPVTTDAGERLEHRVESSALVIAVNGAPVMDRAAAATRAHREVPNSCGDATRSCRASPDRHRRTVPNCRARRCPRTPRGGQRRDRSTKCEMSIAEQERRAASSS
jgi:hypothetical protein